MPAPVPDIVNAALPGVLGILHRHRDSGTLIRCRRAGVATSAKVAAESEMHPVMEFAASLAGDAPSDRKLRRSSGRQTVAHSLRLPSNGVPADCHNL